MQPFVTRMLTILTLLIVVHAPQMTLAQDATCGAPSGGACRQFSDVNGIQNGETFLFQFTALPYTATSEPIEFLEGYADGFLEGFEDPVFDEIDGPRLGQVQLALSGQAFIENGTYDVAMVFFFRDDIVGSWVAAGPETTPMDDLYFVAESTGLTPYDKDRDFEILDFIPTLADLPAGYILTVEEMYLDTDEGVDDSDAKDLDQLEQDDSSSRCDDIAYATAPDDRAMNIDVTKKACSGDIEFGVRCGLYAVDAPNEDRSQTRVGEQRVACKISVYNDGDRRFSVRKSQFLLTDDEGNEYEFTERLSDTDSDLALERLSVGPGDRESGYLFYDIPDDIRPPLFLDVSVTDGDTLTFIVRTLSSWE